MHRIKRIARRFGIDNWMFSAEGMLVNPKTNPPQCTRQTRIQLISDIVSWIFNPRRAANILDIVGYDMEEVLGTTHEIAKRFNLPTILLAFYNPESPPELVLLCIALGVATLEKDFVEIIESHTGDFERETLPSPNSLFKLLFTSFYSHRRLQDAPIIMIDTIAPKNLPEIVEAISGTHHENPLPILWLLSRTHIDLQPLDPLPVISMVAPPLTDHEKALIIQDKHASRRVFFREWVQDEHTPLIPPDVMESLVKDFTPHPELSQEDGIQTPWTRYIPQQIDAAICYLDCYRSLGLMPDQNWDESVASNVGGQYEQLISPAHDGRLGHNQFLLAMLLIVDCVDPGWSESTYRFLFEAFNSFKTKTLDFVELTRSDNFLMLFGAYVPGQEDSLNIASPNLVHYLNQKFENFLDPINFRALIPAVVFAYLSALWSRPIDRLLFAITHFDSDPLDYSSSLTYIHEGIHKGLWYWLHRVTFWDDPDFRNHFGSVLPLMRFHTHSIPVVDFLDFVFCFWEDETPTGFIRTQASSSLDQDLMNACGKMAKALDFEVETFKEFKKFLKDGEASQGGGDPLHPCRLGNAVVIVFPQRRHSLARVSPLLASRPEIARIQPAAETSSVYINPANSQSPSSHSFPLFLTSLTSSYLIIFLIMRFSLVTAAILSLVALAAAQNNRPSEFTGGHRRLRCRHVNRVSWRQFSFEKKIVKLILEDNRGNVLQQQDVNAEDGFADLVVPETSDRVVRLLLIDIETKLVFAQGENISIDCPSRNNDFDGRIGT
ncbi:hypothetical protein NP233_g13086 [Leucocoprinus birnbaumii]|uniref:Uncharacterized protein n=1 Tax=Leucocoprinus birnbaumii TaxID=56174 RepID=A0AAD5VHE9_9AGAR|nr:hypothetical protein NP233_g13086 [Leucocoprinus birnbaumii]